jgi:hypothetical protein
MRANPRFACTVTLLALTLASGGRPPRTPRRRLPRRGRKANNPAWDDSLNRAPQEIAWEAVTSHPHSGVKAGK